MNRVNFYYCEYCSWKKTTRDSVDLKKCPSCGRLIKLKLIEDYQKKIDLENKNAQQKKEFEIWIKENLE